LSSLAGFFRNAKTINRGDFTASLYNPLKYLPFKQVNLTIETQQSLLLRQPMLSVS
jgi:hypothetical protein